MLAFFTALFPSSLSERSFIQKYYANAFGKPLNPKQKQNTTIQRLNETMTIFHQPSIELNGNNPGAAVLRPLAAFNKEGSGCWAWILGM